jgi:hypothetical protein
MASYTKPDIVYEAHNVNEICKKSRIKVKVLDRDSPEKRSNNVNILNDF